MASVLPPEAVDRARRIAESAPVATLSQQAWLRGLLFGRLPAIPETTADEAA
ncbi:MAG: hypothetical protein ACRDP5_06700 [Streptosporangiaceae bacterium]